MEKNLPVEHPWVAVDLDGTLMEDGYYPEFGPPRDGAREAMRKLKSFGVKIMVFTARTQPVMLNGKYSNVNKVVNRILKWGEEHNIPIDYVFPSPKPTFVVAFFDDRALRVNPGVEGWEQAMAVFEYYYSTHLKKDWATAVLPDHLTGVPDETK